MPLRAMQLPIDLEAIVELIANSFQYPDHLDWSLQSDQKENLVGMMKSIKSLWPMVWIARQVSLYWRDNPRGFIWEEDDHPVGIVIFFRQGRLWSIAYVAVLAEYRRQGIANLLMHATLAEIGARGDRVVVLEVLAENAPAYALFEQLGFRKYNGYTDYLYDSLEMLAAFPLPEAYIVRPLRPFDWRTQYELERRITPAEIQRFEPLEPARFRSMVAMRRLVALTDILNRVRRARLAIYSVESGQVVAYCMYTARTRPGGINTMWLELDPAHRVLAPFLIRFLIRTVQQISPGRRIEFTLSDWQSDLSKAVQYIGPLHHVPYDQLGLLL